MMRSRRIRLLSLLIGCAILYCWLGIVGAVVGLLLIFMLYELLFPPLVIESSVLDKLKRRQTTESVASEGLIERMRPAQYGFLTYEGMTLALQQWVEVQAMLWESLRLSVSDSVAQQITLVFQSRLSKAKQVSS